jgi:hypothetical protein
LAIIGEGSNGTVRPFFCHHFIEKNLRFGARFFFFSRPDKHCKNNGEEEKLFHSDELIKKLPV